MTTLAQGDQPADREVLRTISRENAVDVLETGTPYPCVGVYADVAPPPAWSPVGDAVVPERDQLSRFSRTLAALPTRSRR